HAAGVAEMKILSSLVIVAVVIQGKTPSALDQSAAVVKDGVAIYATLNNPTMYEAFVQSGTSEAGKVELRDGDPSTPLGAGPSTPLGASKVTSHIAIPAFGSVELKAGGPYVLVTGLKTPLKAGDTISVTLETDGGDKIPIAAQIK
ncbi:MAG TPA: copper chaperone PCu(A)C, partial [Vicinamibacterales bacterium]|nr:copper chaperone PCu(A)C [Vicinamibacterales bacterium]